MYTVPPAAVNITSSPVDNHFYPGLRLNLTCYIHLTSLLEPSLRISATWEKSGAIVTASEEELLLDPNLVKLGSFLYKTSLVIAALDREGRDDGDYVCMVNVSSDNALIVGFSVMSHRTVQVKGIYIIGV